MYLDHIHPRDMECKAYELLLDEIHDNIGGNVLGFDVKVEVIMGIASSDRLAVHKDVLV